MAGPTWYEILGVAPDATPEQIKAAWREATDKFEPGSGATQFRLFNEAADVLLDPAKRADYDAEIGVGAPRDDAGAPQAAPPPEPADEPQPEPKTAPQPEPQPETQPETEPQTAPETGPETGPETAPAPAPRPGGVRGALTSTLGLAVLAVLATAAVVLVAVLAVRLQHRADDAQAGPEASSVAERALTAALGYDYRKMEQSRDAATKYMTPAYAKVYRRNFDGLISGTAENPGGAVKTKSVVTATVIQTGVVDADRDEVRVLAFVNQNPVVDGKARPTLANRVVATMKRSGDRWLLADLQPIGAGF
jgi:Mce-associated membrane protein